MSTPHELVNPGSLARPVGFSHAVVAGTGRTVYLGGQVAHDADSRIVGETMAEQLDRAAANIVEALAAAGGQPEHIVSMQIFVTDLAAYRRSLSEIGRVYRGRLGSHYPAMALLEVEALFDPAALVELQAIAVVPDQR